jgi:hypothetical protein
VTVRGEGLDGAFKRLVQTGSRVAVVMEMYLHLADSELGKPA